MANTITPRSQTSGAISNYGSESIASAESRQLVRDELYGRIKYDDHGLINNIFKVNDVPEDDVQDALYALSMRPELTDRLRDGIEKDGEGVMHEALVRDTPIIFLYDR